VEQMPSTYTIYFGTNRMPEVGPDGKTMVGFGSNLGPIDGAAVRFGRAQGSVDKDKASMVKGSLYVADETLTGANVVRGSADIFEKLRADMKDGGKPTLVLVHGFSNNFTDAIERAGTIRAFFGLDVNIFAYSWPSRGSAIPVPLPYTDYVHDRETSRAPARPWLEPCESSSTSWTDLIRRSSVGSHFTSFATAWASMPSDMRCKLCCRRRSRLRANMRYLWTAQRVIGPMSCRRLRRCRPRPRTQIDCVVRLSRSS
jgi:Alpha/beta hydrolase of unknown function (DUF900)